MELTNQNDISIEEQNIKFKKSIVLTLAIINLVLSIGYFSFIGLLLIIFGILIFPLLLVVPLFSLSLIILPFEISNFIYSLLYIIRKDEKEMGKNIKIFFAISIIILIGLNIYFMFHG